VRGRFRPDFLLQGEIQAELIFPCPKAVHAALRQCVKWGAFPYAERGSWFLIFVLLI